MKMRRREFFSSAAVAGVSVMAGSRPSAQEGANAAAKVPTYEPKIELLWKSPDRYPNALEASPEGLSEVALRQGIEVVALVHLEHVGFEQRVVGDAAELHAVVGEHVGVVLQVLADLEVAFRFQPGFQER